MYENGAGLQPIAEALNRSRDFVKRTLQAHGVPLRAPGGGYASQLRVPEAEIQLVGRLYERQYSVPEIAEMLNMCKASVSHRLKRSGVRTRPKSERSKLAWSKRR